MQPKIGCIVGETNVDGKGPQFLANGLQAILRGKRQVDDNNFRIR